MESIVPGLLVTIFLLALVAAHDRGSRVPATGVVLSKASTILPVGGAEKLVATITPPQAANLGIVWSTSNPIAAMVSADGLISGMADGVACITATTREGGKWAACEVTVRS
jgi:uncharacterized protein YjdB